MSRTKKVKKEAWFTVVLHGDEVFLSMEQAFAALGPNIVEATQEMVRATLVITLPPRKTKKNTKK